MPDKPPVAEPDPVRRVESATLFQLGREVVIVHHGQEYRLRITKSDKLILTK
jgi:hemin uptake protein HemP